MGVQGYIARIVFVVLVAIAFSYRTQIMDTISRTLGRDTSGSRESQQVQPDTPKPEQVKPKREQVKPPLNPPESDYYNPPFDPATPPDPLYSKSGHRLITKEELAAHGHSGPLKPIWLALMGKVFNVDKGAEHHYGPNGGYKFFTGAYPIVLHWVVTCGALIEL